MANSDNARAASWLSRTVQAGILGLSIGAGLVVTSGLGLVVLTGGFAEAKDTIRNRLGLIDSYAIREQYHMSVGIDNLGNYLPQRQIEESRRHLVMPAFYGDLFEIETVEIEGKTTTVLWFTDTDGFIRNALIDPSDLLRIETLPVDRYEVAPIPE